MMDRIQEDEARYEELEKLLARPEIATNPNQLREVSQELAGLRERVLVFRRWRALGERIAENEELLDDADAEISELARAEIEAQHSERSALEDELVRLLTPVDPNDDKSVVLEIRAGAGGDEASLFAADLFRMYKRYAETRGWSVEPLAMSETEAGGFKELIAEISGKGAFGVLKYESGGHRVQRVPVTEAQGRVHTSMVTVAVLPEAEEVDIQVDDKDLRIDVFRSSGPGGQSVNTTDSAIRVTHLPSGLVVTCQDEKSQHKNKARALKVLRSRLYDQEQRRLAEERAEERRGQIGSGDRSERIRTYNFPQNRVSDHRVGLTLQKLDQIIEGDLEELIEGVVLGLEARSRS